MINYTLGVVAHPRRLEMACELGAATSADSLVVDQDALGPGRNHLKALNQVAKIAKRSGSNWVVILEDDAVPVDGFHKQLVAALEVAPSPIVSLYNGTGHPAQHQRSFAEAAASDASWILHDYMRHAVGYAMERKVFELGFFKAVTPLAELGWPMDDAISKWCRHWQYPVAYSNPSLVDHRDEESVIINRRHRGGAASARRRPRKAHRWGQRLTWNGNHVTV